MTITVMANHIICLAGTALETLIACIYGQIPASGLNGFVLWNITQMNDWKTAVTEMRNGDCSAITGGNYPQLIGIMKKSSFSKTHFTNEEQLMTAHSYAGYPTHKKEHDMLTRRVTNLYQNFKSGKSVFTVELMRFLSGNRYQVFPYKMEQVFYDNGL